MDAAAAARMSDPERNPAFRRRWRKTSDAPAWPPPVHEPEDTVEPTGLELLEQWRRERARWNASP